MPYYNRDPKRDPNFDNWPYEAYIKPLLQGPLRQASLQSQDFKGSGSRLWVRGAQGLRVEIRMKAKIP